MKYFTPTRYIAFNSPDDVVADRADGDWEQALGDYRKHLKKIRSKLPASIRTLSDKMCLHDAEYLGWSKISIPGARGEMAILSVRSGNKRSCLFYVLDAEPMMMRPEASAVFDTDHPHWLYDEIDVARNGTMIHEILFSDGLVLTLQFSDFQVMSLRDEIKSEANGKRSAKKLSATG